VANAEALLLVEAESGKVLQAENATNPWYPASVTKLMTAYVTLKAIKEGRITLDTLFTVSPTAASQSPSKMGFRPGTQVTVDNALKMMLVKSANDMAVVLAEGVGGSIDGFSELMNQNAQRLGMTQTSYVNPNGLPADGQITSARDLAILARAIIHEAMRSCDIALPGLDDGQALTGRSDPDAIVDFYLRLGAPVVVLKLGKEGAIAATGKRRERIAGYPVAAVDATGAGDCFDGAFLAEYVQRGDPFAAARFANVAAALSTLGYGAVAPLPPRLDVEAAITAAEGGR